MNSPFDTFVIFAEMRTGSNLLEAALNAAPDVTCHGEAFNPVFVGYPNRKDVLGVTRDLRERDPERLLERIRSAPGLNGFRFFHDHDPRILESVLNDPRCAKIVLTRNPVDSYVSLKIARQTGQWKLGDPGQRKTATVRFDAAGFEEHLEALQAFQLRLLSGLQKSGQTAFYVDYEDIQDVAVLNGLLRYLGKTTTLDGLPQGLVRQNPGAVEDKVSNPGALHTALARLDRFNLSRTPDFEPRRGPSVPSFVAAASTPLLFMPIKAGPVAAMRGWLSALDADLTGTDRDAVLLEGFTQKTLRQWKRKNVGHRSITVLRHPVARAHAAFCTHILTNDYAEIREALRQVWRLPLPPLDDAQTAGIEPLDPETHRAAFLGFLGFVKDNLAGETGLRTDAAWASQAAIVQGFAQFALPDLILRETELCTGLPALAAQFGRPAPPMPTMNDPAPHALADIYDDAIETAARAAYQRDYMTFGFGPWRD